MSRKISRELRNQIATCVISVGLGLGASHLLKPKSDEEIATDTNAATVVVGNPADGIGAGWFINDHGYILTANHVIDSSQKDIQVILPNKQLVQAQFVCEDKNKDITVLHVNATGNKFLEWADSSRVVQGNRAIQVGTPFSVAFSSSFGHVSYPMRHMPGDKMATVQYDTSTNPGNSGGPVVNGEGKVIGMADEIYASSFFGRQVEQNSGLAFAVTSNEIVRSLPAYLLEGNEPTSLKTQTARRTGPHVFRPEPTCIPAKAAMPELSSN